MAALTRETLRAAFETRRGRRVLRSARVALIAGIAGYLVYELRDLDLDQLRAGLPLAPLFYLLLVVLYFMLPLAQILVYRITWTFNVWASIPAFIKKRILNKDVLGYSGEVYIYAWARTRVDLPSKELLKTIRDQNIVSSAASTTVAIVLVTVFLYSGQLAVTDLIGASRAAMLLGAGVVLPILLILAVRIRRYLFAMAWKVASLIFGVHVVRLVVRQAVEIAMWAVALPDVPLEIWFTYAAVSIIVTRIPFVPSTDLIFMSIAVGLSDVMGVAEAHVFALFAAVAIVNRGINLLFFAGLSFVDRRSTSKPSPASRRPGVT